MFVNFFQEDMLKHDITIKKAVEVITSTAKWNNDLKVLVWLVTFRFSKGEKEQNSFVKIQKLYRTIESRKIQESVPLRETNFGVEVFAGRKKRGFYDWGSACDFKLRGRDHEVF